MITPIEVYWIVEEMLSDGKTIIYKETFKNYDDAMSSYYTKASLAESNLVSVQRIEKGLLVE